MGGAVHFWTPGSGDCGIGSGVLFSRSRNVAADAGLAEILLSVCLDVAGVDIGTAESLVGKRAFHGIFGTGGLAADRVAIGWGVNLRIFLGDVELLFVAEVDLSHAGSSVSTCIRDAAAWLWRVRAVCAGGVCFKESFVARGTQGGSYLLLHQARRFRGIAVIKEHRKVEKQQGTIVELKTALAQQQNEIKVLTAGLEKVSNQVDLTKPAARVVARD